MSLIVRALAASVVLAVVAVPAQARKTHHPPAPPPASHADQAGVFDYYVLSLSWSPTFCLTHRDNVQCDRHKGYGFALHGLWPQYARGGYPQDCDTRDRLTPEAVQFGLTIYPSPNLIDHEWPKHGTCSGLNALDYFKLSDGARTGIKIPPPLESPATARPMTAAQIGSAFVAANPGMPSKSVVVACSGPSLSEVRVCLSRDLRPVACGKGVTNSCRGGPIRIPAVR